MVASRRAPVLTASRLLRPKTESAEKIAFDIEKTYVTPGCFAQPGANGPFPFLGQSQSLNMTRVDASSFDAYRRSALAIVANIRAVLEIALRSSDDKSNSCSVMRHLPGLRG